MKPIGKGKKILEKANGEREKALKWKYRHRVNEWQKEKRGRRRGGGGGGKSEQKRQPNGMALAQQPIVSFAPSLPRLN